MCDNPSMNGFDNESIKEFNESPENMGISQYWRSELNDRDKEVATLKAMNFKLQQQLLTEIELQKVQDNKQKTSFMA